MKQLLLASVALLLGCGGGSYVHSDTTLGRVIVYRSGVAYFERSANVDDDHLDLSVPADKVDDFLKSLRVVDAQTGSSAPVAYPATSSPETGLIDMRIDLPGPPPHRVKLSYVTEAPAWKPSYRVAVGKGKEVSLEGFAIVDNVSGEDWTNIQLGVASSSALSFRFDLRSVRLVPRETLQSTDQFAIAPPVGGPTYGGQAQQQELTLDLSDEEIGGGARYLAPAEQIAQGSAHVSWIEGKRTTLARSLDQARRERDVVKTLCLNDKLTQLDMAARSARERQAALDAARARGDKDVAAHELTVLSVVRRRAEQLSVEANQCIGQELGYVGGSSVTVTIDPSLPPDDDYPRNGPPIHAPAPPSGDGRREPVDAGSTPSAPKPALKDPEPAAHRPPARPGDRGREIEALVARIRTGNRRVVIEGYAGDRDADKVAASLDRASKVRDQLIEHGVDPDRVAAVGNGQRPGRGPGVRVVEVPSEAEMGLVRDTVLAGKAQSAGDGEPIGAAHFESPTAMTVASGASAMVPMFKVKTEGSFVYLYDRESARGNDTYPFRAVRLANPTAEALESGPVTVFGEGRFIGEGLCEPIPAHSVAFVPFALDRQIVAERKEVERDDIARVLAVRRGVFSAEVRHTRQATVSLRNRMAEVATVYVRHTVAAGYELGEAPAARERIGAAHLFRVEVPANGSVDVVIEEGTLQSKSLDFRSPEGMELVRAYMAKPAADAKLKEAMGEIVKRTREMDEIDQRIATARNQIQEYRARMEELERQVVTLRAVKGGSDPGAGKAAGSLLQHLEKKLRETSDRLSQATIEVVSLQEKLMNARIAREDALAGAVLTAGGS